MKKNLILLVVILLLMGSTLYAATYVGGGITKEINGQGRTFVGGRFTFGSMFSIDVDGDVVLSNPNPMYFLQIYTFANLCVPISNFELYAGFSPTFFFYQGTFSSNSFQNQGYLHAGAAFHLQSIRIYGEVFKVLYYSPIHLGNVWVMSVGAQFGF